MIKIGYRLDDSAVIDWLKRAPRIMEKHIDRNLGRAAHEVAREEKRAAPKAHGILTNSIRVIREGTMRYVVAPGVNYASYPETGTGRGGGPGFRTMLDWVKVKRIIPNHPAIQTQEDLAHVLARLIPLKGTRAQPYVQPTAEKMRSRVMDLARQGVVAGVREASRQ